MRTFDDLPPVRSDPFMIGRILEARRVESGHDSCVYYSRGEALHRYFPHISLKQVQLYKLAMAVAGEVAASFETETKDGLIRYQVNQIQDIVELPSNEVVTVSQFWDKSQGSFYDRKKFAAAVFNGLEELTDLVTATTGLQGIRIISSNTVKYQTDYGVLCVITDICVKLALLRKATR